MANGVPLEQSRRCHTGRRFGASGSGAPAVAGQPGGWRGAGGGWAKRQRLQVSQGQVRGDEGEFGASRVFMGTSRGVNGRGARKADTFTLRYVRSRTLAARRALPYSWHQGCVSGHSGSADGSRDPAAARAHGRRDKPHGA